MALRFNNETKIRKQMKARGWTDQMIEEALQTPGIPAVGKDGPATRHVHPTTGQWVVVDNTTGRDFSRWRPGVPV